VTDVGADATSPEVLDVRAKAELLVWDGKSSDDEHNQDSENLFLRS
jgi:hypothetical protein